MQAVVHFAVGVVGALLVLTGVDWPVRREFLAAFASAFWAMLPDGHWLLSEFGVDGAAAAWKAVHGSALANLCWGHRLLDRAETGRPNLEAGVALAALVVAVGLYYRYNDWTVR
ncbi:MAG: hypothetical protein ABEJ61_07205 [Haloferacaceae archaeon]